MGSMDWRRERERKKMKMWKEAGRVPKVAG
jgi:hypothetical protein